MKKPKENITIKTGSADKFMMHVKRIMRSADQGKTIETSHTFAFENPQEMLHFLTNKKLALIDSIRNNPDSITNIAKLIKRNRASVYRDIHDLEEVGIVKILYEVNPGHGRHKIVQLTASKLKLEAYI
jgi:predicted transcriptional regulator